MLGLFALQTPAPWGRLWLLVPLGVAASLLAGWRYGVRGVIIPLALFGLALGLVGPYVIWVWWIPVASLSGLWMGLREEGGGPTAGNRAWMLLPALLFAAAMPWALHYGDLIRHVEQQMRFGDTQLVEMTKQFGYSPERIRAIQAALTDQAQVRVKALPQLFPSVVFVWIALLVVAGRALSARAAAAMRWPSLSRAGLTGWRLPDGAVWLLILGLALLVGRWPAWSPTAWTLLINTALGFGVQGIAVVESLLLARGVPLSIIVLTLLFVFTLAMPVVMLMAVAVGLSDVWLDYRRLEPTPDRDET
jgi:hypothetical protein